jgi:hypothetical protein
MGTVEDHEEESEDDSNTFPPHLRVRFPTVSAATARFGSSSYNMVLVTTTLHAACSQVFNYWWYNDIKSNNEVDNGVDVISILATIGLFRWQL